MRRSPILLAAAAALALSACDLHFRPRRPAPPPPAPRPVPKVPSPAEIEAAEWAAIEETSASLVRGFEFGGALRFLDGELRLHPAREDRLSRMKEAVLLAANAEYGGIKKTASAALAQGELHEATSALERALHFDIPEIVEDARHQIHDAELAATRKRHDEALPLLGPLLVELSEFLRAQKKEEAMKLLDRAAVAHQELRAEIDWLRGTVVESHGIFLCLQRGLHAMKGETATIGGETVKLSEVRDGVAVFSRDAGDPVEVRLGDLPPDLILKAAVRGGATEDYVGQFLLFTGHIPEARAAWKNSGIREALDTIADRVEEALAGTKK
ncbi:MAG: hypothetical protein K8T20_02055 [Planctomycetes bacterium]|nr:hypothetical protein [Planctomycetota bacterium]